MKVALGRTARTEPLFTGALADPALPLDLPAIRRTEAYRTAYNAEVNRLLVLPPKERLAACQNAW